MPCLRSLDPGAAASGSAGEIDIASAPKLREELLGALADTGHGLRSTSAA